MVITMATANMASIMVMENVTVMVTDMERSMEVKNNQIKQNMRDFKNIKVAVAGTGYVGLSIATLLCKHSIPF